MSWSKPNKYFHTVQFVRCTQALDNDPLSVSLAKLINFLFSTSATVPLQWIHCSMQTGRLFNQTELFLSATVRPGMTVAVDWALKTNDLSIYPRQYGWSDLIWFDLISIGNWKLEIGYHSHQSEYPAKMLRCCVPVFMPPAVWPALGPVVVNLV